MVLLPPAPCLLKTCHGPAASDPELVQRGRKGGTPLSAHGASSALQRKGSWGRAGETRCVVGGERHLPHSPAPAPGRLPSRQSWPPDLTAMPACPRILSCWPEPGRWKDRALLRPWEQAGGLGVSTDGIWCSPLFPKGTNYTREKQRFFKCPQHWPRFLKMFPFDKNNGTTWRAWPSQGPHVTAEARRGHSKLPFGSCHPNGDVQGPQRVPHPLDPPRRHSP